MTDAGRRWSVTDDQIRTLLGFRERFDEIGAEIEDVKALIAEVTAKMEAAQPRPVRSGKDPRVDTVLEQSKMFEREIAAQKTALAAMSNALEQLSVKFHELEERPVIDSSCDVIELRADIKQLWHKIKELTDVAHEVKDDFLPRVDLTKLDKPAARTLVIERAVLPRITAPVMKSPREDPRVGETATRVEKQGDLLVQMKRTLDVHQRNLIQLDDNKADRVPVQQLLEQFRLALGELNNRIGSLKRALIGKVDASDITAMITEMMAGSGDDTSTGTGPIKCLCCGRARKTVAGALDDPTIAQRLGAPTSTRVLGDGGGQVCFVYGERGDMYIGRSGTGKPMFSKAPDAPDSVRPGK
jgi:hypothetical protein